MAPYSGSGRRPSPPPRCSPGSVAQRRGRLQPAARGCRAARPPRRDAATPPLFVRSAGSEEMCLAADWTYSAWCAGHVHDTMKDVAQFGGHPAAFRQQLAAWKSICKYAFWQK